jgi:hypothetical protein
MTYARDALRTAYLSKVPVGAIQLNWQSARGKEGRLVSPPTSSSMCMCSSTCRIIRCEQTDKETAIGRTVEIFLSKALKIDKCRRGFTG